MPSDVRERLKAKAGKGGRVKSIGEPITTLQKPKRKGVNGSVKGGVYERKIAKLFSRWSGEMIRRTPRSGGWAGKAEFDVAGDLVCGNAAFSLHIEAKNREDWALEDLLTGHRAKGELSIQAWWQQTTRECPVGKLPILVFTRNRLADLVMMREEDLYKLSDKDTFTRCISFIWDGLPHGNGPVVLFTLQRFFAQLRPPVGCANHATWKPERRKK
jgi:hypothetical protein